MSYSFYLGQKVLTALVGIEGLPILIRKDLEALPMPTQVNEKPLRFGRVLGAYKPDFVDMMKGSFADRAAP